MSQESNKVAPPRPKRNTHPVVYTAEEGAELLAMYHYDPETGDVTWKKDGGRWGNFKAGTKAGYIADQRLRLFFSKGRKILAYRFAFFAMTGRWPEFFIDHKDGNPLNNKFTNLRAATQSQNQCNRPTPRVSASGIKGVYIQRRGNTVRFVSQIVAQGKKHHIGVFLTAKEAAAARHDASIRLHGEFANLD